MGFTVKDLLQDRARPITIRPGATVQDALDVMIENDFSQLPVVDDNDKVLGMITNDSILRALSNFRLTIDKLKVSQAMQRRVDTKRPDEDLFDLLDDLATSYAVLIVDANNTLVGIVTNSDTAEYFRERAENMMLVEDIETAMKDHILAAFRADNGATDDAALAGAITHVCGGDGDGNNKLKGALINFLQKQLGNIASIDQAGLDQVLAAVQPKRKPQTFVDLTFNEYLTLLISGGQWDQYKDTFDGLEATALRQLLEDVRDTRNVLAHFRQVVSAKQHAQLKFCTDWFEQHKPPEINPSLPEAAQPPSSSTTKGNQSTVVVTTPDDEVTALKSTIIDAAPEFAADEERRADDSKYAPLARMLQSIPARQKEIVLSFSNIEAIIGDELPGFARKHRSWWANDSVGHVQSILWLQAGWRVDRVNISKEQVVFTRNAESERAYIDFFTALMGDLRKANLPFRLVDALPNGDRKLTAVTLPGVGWICYSFTLGERYRIELYLGVLDKDGNKANFDILLTRRAEIEAAFGAPLAWERLDDACASRIAAYAEGSISDEAGELEALRRWSVRAMLRFHPAITTALGK